VEFRKFTESSEEFSKFFMSSRFLAPPFSKKGGKEKKEKATNPK